MPGSAAGGCLDACRSIDYIMQRNYTVSPPNTRLSDMMNGMSRREMLGSLWFSIIGLLACQIFGMGVYFSMPRLRTGQYGGMIEIGPVTELPAVHDPPVNFPRGKFWLVRTDSGLSALYKACTHLDCLFNWNPQEEAFVCPCHGSRFARDGRLLSGPATRSLDRFVVQIVAPDGEIVAATDPESGAPVGVPAEAGSPQPDRNAPAQTETAPDAVSSPYTVRVDTRHRIHVLPT